MGEIILTGGKPIYSEEKVFQCHFAVISLKWTAPAWNPRLRFEKPATNCPKHAGPKRGMCVHLFRAARALAMISFVNYSHRLLATNCTNQVTVSARFPVGKAPWVKRLKDPAFDSQHRQQIFSSPKSSEQLQGPTSLLFIAQALYRAARPSVCPLNHI